MSGSNAKVSVQMLPDGVTITSGDPLNYLGICGFISLFDDLSVETDGLASLASFQVQDGKVNQGYNPPLRILPVNGVKPFSDNPLDQTVWTSVTSGSSNSIIKFVTSSLLVSNTKVILHVTDGPATLATDGVALSGTSTNLSLTGGAVSTTGTATIKLCTKQGNPLKSVSLLKVMVLPPRTVSVGIYYVIDENSHDSYDENKTLADAPTPQSIIDTLNEIYQQAGISFVDKTNGQGGSAEHPIPIAYDKLADGQLSEHAPLHDPKSEFDYLWDGLVGKGGELKIVIVKSSFEGEDYGYTPARYIREHDATCFIYVKQIRQDNRDGAVVAAHEVGHILGGVHDNGKYPPQSLLTHGGLMKPGNEYIGKDKINGKWLRHENWEKANFEAFDYRP